MALALGELAHQQVDVLGSLPQRRQADGDDVEAVVEVGPEAALVDHLLQVLVGGGDDAHIDAARPAAAQAEHGVVLQDAQ